MALLSGSRTPFLTLTVPHRCHWKRSFISPLAWASPCSLSTSLLALRWATDGVRAPPSELVTVTSSVHASPSAWDAVVPSFSSSFSLLLSSLSLSYLSSSFFSSSLSLFPSPTPASMVATISLSINQTRAEGGVRRKDPNDWLCKWPVCQMVCVGV
jgi:hypothetical protein